MNEEKNIHNIIQKIQLSLDHDDAQMGELLGLSEKQFKRFFQRPQTLKLRNFLNLSRKLNVNYQKLYHDDVDIEAICRQYFGNKQYVPDRYQKCAYSRIRSVAKIIDRLRAMRGENFIEELYCFFQINDSVLQNHNGFININFMGDLFRYLKSFNFTDTDFEYIGIVSHDPIIDAKLYNFLSSKKTPALIYEYIINEITHYYEKNFSYSIEKMKNNCCIIDCKQKEEVAESLGKKYICSDETCTYRGGVFAGMPRMAGFTHSSVDIISSVHQGDTSTRYYIEFNNDNQPRILH